MRVQLGNNGFERNTVQWIIGLIAHLQFTSFNEEANWKKSALYPSLLSAVVKDKIL
jgi:hypothetical protein